MILHLSKNNLLIIKKSDTIITIQHHKKGEIVFRSFLKRVKSQKGMSGVLVALLLVIVGVGLVAGINTFMKDASTTIQNEANTSINSAITATR